MSTVASGFSVSMSTSSVAPVTPMLPTASLYSPLTVTEPVPSKSSSAVNVAVQVTPPSLDDRPLTAPPTTVRSVLSKSTTASVNVIVTSELLSLSLRSVSAMSTVASGFSVSMSTSSVAPVTPMLPTASLYSPLTVTEPVPSKSSSAVNVAVQVIPPSLDDRPLTAPADHRQVGVVEPDHRLGERDRHQRAVVAVVEVGVGDVDRRVGFSVSMSTLSVAPVAPMLPTASV